MAQYDLVFVQNNASSGVAFSEIKLGKPPDVGFALTQHPNTGLLSWVQSMNLITVYGQNDTVNFDQVIKTGMYHIHRTTTTVNGPRVDGGILTVYNSPSGIYQFVQGFDLGSPIKPVLFSRFLDLLLTETWSTWREFGGASATQWGDDPEFSSAVRDEIAQSTLKAVVLNGEYEMDLSPEHINTLIIITPDERETFFPVSIPSNADLAFLQKPLFEVGSVYTIRSMNDVPVRLYFDAPGYVLAEAQVVHTNGFYHPGKHKSIQLICIGNDEWLVEGAVPDPPVFEEDEDPEPIKN